MSEKSMADRLVEFVSPGPTGSDTRATNTPESWRPMVDVDNSKGGFIISKPRKEDEDENLEEIFIDFKLDQSKWAVSSLRRSRWQTFSGEWLEATRINLLPIGYEKENDLDLEKLVDELKKWRPSKSIKASTGPLSSVYAIGDPQYGKDAGDGSAGTVRRVLYALEEAVVRQRELVKIGRKIGTIVLPQLGDCIEGSVSQGGRVIGASDLHVTQQVRLSRRMLMKWVKTMAPLAESLIVPAVNGNHDSAHRITMTNPTDGWQLDIVSAVQDACEDNPALAHVKFRYPEKESGNLTIDVNGFLIGMAHGHEARDTVKWWSGQSQGKTPIGAADILLTGHYHHFVAKQVGPRLWLQVPAMDGGSPWWKDRSGLESPTGIVSLVVGVDYDPRRDLAVIGGEQR